MTRKAALMLGTSITTVDVSVVALWFNQMRLARRAALEKAAS